MPFNKNIMKSRQEELFLRDIPIHKCGKFRLLCNNVVFKSYITQFRSGPRQQLNVQPQEISVRKEILQQ